MPRRRPWLRLIAAVVGVVVLAFGVYTAYRVSTFADSVFAGSRPAPVAAAPPEPSPTPESAMTPAPTPPPVATSAAPTATPAPSPTPVDDGTLLGKLRTGQRLTFLLIGYGGDGHDGPYLTDALVAVSYDPKTQALALFNIPRDLWVQGRTATGQRGAYRKVNEIFSNSLGPGALAGRALAPDEHDQAAWGTAAVVEEVLGLAIDGWISADFQAVRRVVDGMGGVMVDVETAFDDYNYPRYDSSATGTGVMHVHFDAGRQRLNGERALQYVRSRYSLQDGTDFGRSRRQQRLLLALKEQLLTPAMVPKVFTLMDAVQGHLRTSLSLAEARALLDYARDHQAGVQAAPSIIDTSALLVLSTSDAGASILVPRAGQGNYSQIRRYVQARLQGAEGEPTNGQRVSATPRA